jgi:hypothetical protein
MERGIGPIADPGSASSQEALLAVSGHSYAATEDGKTAILATGDLDLHAIREAIAALAVKDVAVDAFAYAGDVLVIVVPKLDSANALRAIETALDAVPSQPAIDGRR